MIEDEELVSYSTESYADRTNINAENGVTSGLPVYR